MKIFTKQQCLDILSADSVNPTDLEMWVESKNPQEAITEYFTEEYQESLKPWRSMMKDTALAYEKIIKDNEDDADYTWRILRDEYKDDGYYAGVLFEGASIY